MTIIATIWCLAALVVFAIAAIHDPANNPDANNGEPWGTV